MVAKQNSFYRFLIKSKGIMALVKRVLMGVPNSQLTTIFLTSFQLGTGHYLSPGGDHLIFRRTEGGDQS